MRNAQEAYQAQLPRKTEDWVGEPHNLWVEVFNFILTFFGFTNFHKELRMLSSVTLNCRVTKIVMNSGSQLS